MSLRPKLPKKAKKVLKSRRKFANRIRGNIKDYFELEQRQLKEFK